MINYVKGDLFTTDADIIAHGCNCHGGFGSGVAGVIAKTYPEVRKAYLDKFDNTKKGWELGEIQPVPLYREVIAKHQEYRRVDTLEIPKDTSKTKFVVNCATQDRYLPRGVCHADYKAIRTCMERLKAFAQAEGGLSIAIPKIGAGLAGGDWSIIEKILTEVFADYDITVYTLDGASA